MQSILKRLETPYSDDMEDEEPSFPQAVTAEPPSSLADQREKKTFFQRLRQTRKFSQ